MAKNPKNKKTKDETQVTRITREVKVPLDEKALTERREIAATERAAQDSAEAELESLTTSYKEQKKEIDEQISTSETKIATTLREIKEKKAKILTEVDEVKNYDTKKVEFWWPSFAKGEKVDEREFTPEEHQMRMFQEKADSIPSTGASPMESEAAVQ